MVQIDLESIVWLPLVASKERERGEWRFGFFNLQGCLSAQIAPFGSSSTIGSSSCSGPRPSISAASLTAFLIDTPLSRHRGLGRGLIIPEDTRTRIGDHIVQTYGFQPSTEGRRIRNCMCPFGKHGHSKNKRHSQKTLWTTGNCWRWIWEKELGSSIFFSFESCQATRVFKVTFQLKMLIGGNVYVRLFCLILTVSPTRSLLFWFAFSGEPTSGTTAWHYQLLSTPHTLKVRSFCVPEFPPIGVQ